MLGFFSVQSFQLTKIMKTIFFSFLFSLSALVGLAQSPVNVQKGGTAGTNNITGDLNIGTGKTLTFASGSTLTIASGATVNTPAGAIPWSAISNTPTSIAGYGILDPLVYTNVTYSNPSWITSLAASKISGVLASTNMPAYTGDVTSSSGATVNTLAIVNGSPGTIGSGTAIPVITVIGKGLVTSVTTATNTPAFANITGLPSTVAGYGITNGAALDALGAVATNGILQRTSTNGYSVATYVGLAWNAGVLSVTADAGLPSQLGANNQFLTSNGTSASWSAVPLTTGVSGILPIANGGTGRATGTTAYGLIAAGTTATGVQQTLPAGLTTEILVGGGVSVLPAWTTATGSGAPVRATSPILVTPALGVATATLINGNTLTSGSWTLTGSTNATFAFTAGMTVTASTNGNTYIFPATSATLARTDAGQTFTGTNAFAGITATAVTNSGLTSGRVPFSSTGGLMADASSLTFNSGTGALTATSFVGNVTGNITGTVNGNTLTAGSSTYTGTAAQTYTFPTTSASIARTDAAQTFTGTQTFGAILGTTLNGNTFTSGSYTITGSAGDTFAFTQAMTLSSSTDGNTYTFPSTSATLARTDAAQTFTGTQTFSGNFTVSNGFTISAGSSREPLSLTGSGNDTIFHIINTNTGGTDWQLRSIGPTASGAPAGSLVFFNSTIQGWMDPSGNLKIGSSLTSASGQPLILATGTSGTAVSIASATNLVTLANSLTMAGTLTGASTLTGTNSVTAASTTNLIMTGGTSGAQITLGQGASGVAAINSAGTGTIFNSNINITSNNPGLRINDVAGSHYNWFVGGQTNLNNGFEITPSTATGGSTFSTPLFTLTQAGVSTFTTTAAIVNVAGTTEATTTANSGSFTTAGGANITKTMVAKHFGGQGTAPTGAVGAGAGTSPGSVTFDATANDVGGIVSLTTGTLPTAASAVLTVTFNGAYATAPHVTITPGNAATALLSGVTMVYATSTTGTFVINAGTTGLTAATAYSWIYHADQ